MSDNKDWSSLSMRERAAYIRKAVFRGLSDIDDIREEYHLYGGGGDTQQKEEPIYKVLPALLQQAGLDVRVTSGYRSSGKAGNAGDRSWHPRHGAVDIVPQGNTTFEDIENVIYNNPRVKQYLLSHNFGLLDESGRSKESRELSQKTGSTGAHFHFGRDTSAVNSYRQRVNALQGGDNGKVVYFTNPDIPLKSQEPLVSRESTQIQSRITPQEVLQNVTIPKPINIDDDIEQDIAAEQTLPEIEVIGQERTPNPLEILSQIQESTPTPLVLEPYQIPQIQNKVNEIAAQRNSFLQRDLEDRLLAEERRRKLGYSYRDGSVQNDIEQMQFLRNMSANGGKLFDTGGNVTVVPFTQKAEVIITPDTEYNQYLNTLPDNQRFTPNDKYDSYLYWKLNGRPRNFREAVQKEMFTYDHSDNAYHANSIAFDDNTGIGYFMKPKNHDTVGYELDWFNKGLVTEEGGRQRAVTPEEAKELEAFRNKYILIDDPDRPNYYRYQPIVKAEGGPLNIILDTNSYGGGGQTSVINVPSSLRGLWNKAKQRLYRTITPKGYHLLNATKEFISGDDRDFSKFTPAENEVWARYLGVPYEGESSFEKAVYVPTKGGATYDDVIKFKDESQILSDDVLRQLLQNQMTTGKNTLLIEGNESGLGTYTVSLGEDENGKYISYYDDWDINPTRGLSAKYKIPFLEQIGDIVPGTHPFTVYGRRYYTDEDLRRVIEK